MLRTKTGQSPKWAKIDKIAPLASAILQKKKLDRGNKFFQVALRFHL